VAEVAEKRGVPRAQVALAWLLSTPTVTAPIVGATTSGHLDDAVAAIRHGLEHVGDGAERIGVGTDPVGGIAHQA
jgi:aryl-alcohol dehydrogenase-like predicted oxidoreductase